MRKPELLAPGGSLEKLKTAIDFGADAVYVGGEAYSLRTAAENFTAKELREGIDYAHARGKKVYLTANIIPHNEDIEKFEGFIKEMAPMGFDAVLIADLGMFDMVRELVPSLPVHISTQANNVNYRSAMVWHRMGAKRIVLAREMSFEEIAQIRAHIPPELELEAFVHGAMCISYSGRCLLSNYMTHRDANQGSCSHPCRWNYKLVEEKRPGQYMDVFENERGTFIFNSKDLCMIEHIPELVKSGIESFKIEGRVKTAYYVATVVGAYRREIDRYFADPEVYTFNEEELKELCKVSHRPYTTGFYYHKPDENSQVYTTSSYIREYDLVGLVLDYDENTHIATITQRNRFFDGDEIEIMQPGEPYFVQRAHDMVNEEGEKIEVAPHPEMILTMPMAKPVKKGAMLRKKK
ncbi:MAG: U32 family peptidase C-terminal domain-containing protein [Clostridiales bacterium]|nr:U32 family peptidase C-terminal domain-containing protein [Clostridiales bacterium]